MGNINELGSIYWCNALLHIQISRFDCERACVHLSSIWFLFVVVLELYCFVWLCLWEFIFILNLLFIIIDVLGAFMVILSAIILSNGKPNFDKCDYYVRLSANEGTMIINPGGFVSIFGYYGYLGFFDPGSSCRYFIECPRDYVIRLYCYLNIAITVNAQPFYFFLHFLLPILVNTPCWRYVFAWRLQASAHLNPIFIKFFFFLIFFLSSFVRSY